MKGIVDRSKALRLVPTYWKWFFSNEEIKKIFAKEGIVLGHPFQLRPYLGVLIEDKKEVNIADIGSGAITLIGHIWKDVKVNVFPSDIMANEFKKILTKFNISSIVPVEEQDMSKLTYKDNFFDIVYCSNALDHTLNPILAIKEMIRICKPEGYVYLRHARNEGKREKYGHLHRWNICPTIEGDCLFWELERKNDFLLSSINSNFITEYKKDWDGYNGWDGEMRVISILKKEHNE